LRRVGRFLARITADHFTRSSVGGIGAKLVRAIEAALVRDEQMPRETATRKLERRAAAELRRVRLGEMKKTSDVLDKKRRTFIITP